MKLDLNYLNRFSKLAIEEEVSFDNSYIENTEIRELSDVYVEGEATIDYEDSINLNITISGTMVLPCAITLKDVLYKFETNIEENLGKFEEIYKKNKNSLDISNILWENIVLEIPIRVVSHGAEPSNTSGDGWELISE